MAHGFTMSVLSDIHCEEASAIVFPTAASPVRQKAPGADAPRTVTLQDPVEAALLRAGLLRKGLRWS